MDSDSLRSEALAVAKKLRSSGLHGEAQRLRAAAQHDRLEQSRRHRQVTVLEGLVNHGRSLLADAKGAA